MRKIETTMDRIASFYVNSTAISAKEEEIRIRWHAAHASMLNFKSREQTAKILCKEFKMSMPQAYRDISNALRLFGDVNKTNKNGVRNIIFEYAMKAFQMAMADKDVKEMNRAITNMVKIEALDKEDSDIPVFKDVQQHIYIIQADPKLLGQHMVNDIDEEIKKYKEKKAITISIDEQKHSE